MPENVKLDIYDRRMLYELDKDSSISLSLLSKKLKRSKQFTLYRMKNLESSGIIKGYNAIVDMSKLGYITYRIYIKFQQTTYDSEMEFVKYIKEDPAVWSITFAIGNWSVVCFVGVKTVAEFHNAWDRILEKYRASIKEYAIAVYAPVFNFNRTFFYDKANEPISIRGYGLGKEQKYDGTDLEIIRLYASNVRESLVTIANKVKISADTVRNRIKNMEKHGIIVGYHLNLDIEKMGYTPYKVDLHLKSTKRADELFKYCMRHANIYQVMRPIGGSDFEFELDVRNVAEFRKIIDGMREEFKDTINDYEFFSFRYYELLSYVPD